MTLRIGSLFSGIGGLELGLEWAGVGRTVWQVEQDEYCRAVLAKHWPDAERFNDVREVGAHNLPMVDVICGGFPCQDISYAGKGAGLEGERSGLWYEFARIVREMGPDYIVVENVRALLTRGLDAVLGTLADCGYDAEWSVLGACDVGAPHRRDRLFILAHRARIGCGTRLQGRPAGVRAREAERAFPLAHAHGAGRGEQRRSLAVSSEQYPAQCSGEDVADAVRSERWSDAEVTARQRRENAGVARDGSRWTVEPDVGRVANGVPSRVDRLRALGNAVVPEVAEVVGRRLLEIHEARIAA